MVDVVNTAGEHEVTHIIKLIQAEQGISEECRSIVFYGITEGPLTLWIVPNSQ